MKSIDQIFQLYDTDKSSRGHNYGPAYDEFFSNLKDKNITLLEIGVRQGKSIASWCDYFINGKILGADIDLSQMEPKLLKQLRVCDRCSLEEIDITAQNSNKKIAPYGPFDIIIDDASHLSMDVIGTFEAYFFNHLKSGGYYIVEDASCSYGRPGVIRKLANKLAGKNLNSFRRKSLISVFKLLKRSNPEHIGRHHPHQMVNYFKQLVDSVNLHGVNILSSSEMSAYLTDTADKYEKHIEWIQFRNQLIIIKKR